MALNNDNEINTFVCDDCHQEVTEFYEYRDDHRNKTICEVCFNWQFAINAKNKNKDWFFNNFNNPDKQFPKLNFLRSK